ncbi:hypothetical protein BDV18DRAFT_21277 [Aspergillus unguis]
MIHKHGENPVPKDEEQIWFVSMPPPQKCPICGMGVSDWPGFWACLRRHCLISDSDRDQGGSNGDDSDGDDDDGDNGNGGNNKYYPPPGNGNGYFGDSPSGFHYNQLSSNQLGGPSAWSGTDFYRHQAAPSDSSIPLDSVGSVSSSTASEPKSKQTLANIDILKYPKPGPVTRWGDIDNNLFGTFRTEVCLRFESSNSKDHSGLIKPTAADDTNELASAPLKSNTSQELYRLRYLEFRIFEDQKHGSLLTYAHEALVISQPGHIESIIVASIHGMYSQRRSTFSSTPADLPSNAEVLYQTVELRSSKRPEIPGDCLFYLAKEKDHRSCEANLEATRRAPPKKRGHLRVRVKAIAGVLALRAAVSKTAVAVNHSEATGDGWELGIPLPAPEEMAKVFAWLIQVLMFFLRAPPNLKVFLMIEDDSLEVPTLEDGLI